MASGPFVHRLLKLRPPSVVALWLGGTALMLALYTLVFMSAGQDAPAAAFANSIANVLPLALLAAASRAILASVIRRTVAVQAALHIVLAVGFATTWYALILVVQALFRGSRGEGFSVHVFSGPAFIWQSFQGLILYALVAAVCYAVRGGREAASVSIVTTAPLERYLTRSGDEMVPVNVRDIVSITGAQDYAEVATLNGRHLVRMSLGEFERRLDPARFLRVHRSTIVNLDHLARAEAAGGGRLIAHMANGEVVAASRTGSQLLRSLIV